MIKCKSSHNDDTIIKAKVRVNYFKIARDKVIKINSEIKVKNNFEIRLSWVNYQMNPDFKIIPNLLLIPTQIFRR